MPYFTLKCFKVISMLNYVRVINGWIYFIYLAPILMLISEEKRLSYPFQNDELSFFTFRNMTLISKIVVEQSAIKGLINRGFS